MIIRFSIAIFLFLMTECPLFGQQVSFSNINTTNGLSDNFIRSIAVDKKGFLWIGTNEELNVYDGYSITTFSHNEYPEIPSKITIHLFCDSHNNVWLGSEQGVAWVDEKRNFHQVVLNDTIKRFNCPSIFETKTYGMVLYTDLGHFYFDKTKNKWSVITGVPEKLGLKHFSEISPFNDDQQIYATDSSVSIFDFASKKIVFEFPATHIASVCKLNDSTVAAAAQENILYYINTHTKKIDRTFDMFRFGGSVNKKPSWVEIRMGAGQNLLYASRSFGFFIIDKEGKVTHFSHESTNPYSIASDRVQRLLGTADGTVVVGTERYGLSIFNVLKKEAVYQKLFTDGKGNFFDGWLTQMAMDKDGTFWFGAMDRLIHWDKKNNVTAFYQYNKPDTVFGYKNPEIYRLCIDRLGQIWVSFFGSGIALFNRASGTFTRLPRNTDDSSQVSDYVFDLFEASDGKIWVGGKSGFYRINPATKKTETVKNDNLLKPFYTTNTSGFAEDSYHRIWISTNGKGVLCYDPANKIIKQFTKKNGLLDDICLDMMRSSTDDIYITSYKGFNVIHPNGVVSTYTKANGLRFDKADAFLEDNDGKIWISNAKCLAKFDPLTKNIEIFDEHQNLNNGGFKPTSSLKTPDGELLWGTQSGINYFYPEQLIRSPEPLHVNIYNVLAGDSVFTATDEPARIRYKNNSLEFDFVAINLQGSHNIRYQYMLEGYDSKWQEGTDIRQARYSSLPPGNYTFKVRASADRENWTESVNSFQFTIIAPVYMRWWFKIAVALLVIVALYYFSRRRSLQLKRQRDELETEQVINYFASSMYEHQTVDDILWDVARNCIGRLQFEDCVIYLLDEKRNVLVQKAAHGPKSHLTFEINTPIDIPLGKGIVGTVAANGKAELIKDTSKDSRYIVDDKARLSEISVPIISTGKVLGVIDCEHSKKGFFTQKHLSILTTIASLCANKIIRAITEEEKKQTETMLAETKQKMAETEMQALRAQMNPHFIFNCLNSINRYIVKSDQVTASLYLTRFAKLIRLILDNSHSKNVILSNELEALRLYIDMESLRFDNKFTYVIEVDKNVSADSIEVPPLIIQPYVENAIWHGLLHKTEGGHLHIHISLLSPDMLQCTIQDNGVGREKATELKSKSATKKKSLGMELTENRLLLLNKYAEVHSSIEIIDLTNEHKEPTGTKVILKIPFGG